MFGNEGFDITNGKILIRFIIAQSQLLVDCRYPGMNRSKCFGLHIMLQAKKLNKFHPYKFQFKKYGN
jgi:hypothetical protein